MSVVTNADKALDEARENINQVYKNLLTVLDPDTWGHTDYNKAFIDKIQEAAIKVLELKRLIN